MGLPQERNRPTSVVCRGARKQDHCRKDLTPNVCAVYVDEEFRNQGIAGFLLQYVCDDMSTMGIDTLYLLTDHTGFYERYGWEFLCMVRGSDEEPSRMYVHHARPEQT